MVWKLASNVFIRVVTVIPVALVIRASRAGLLEYCVMMSITPFQGCWNVRSWVFAERELVTNKGLGMTVPSLSAEAG